MDDYRVILGDKPNTTYEFLLDGGPISNPIDAVPAFFGARTRCCCMGAS
jgi:hypothetical protein